MHELRRMQVRKTLQDAIDNRDCALVAARGLRYEVV
jgi:hypothetical protein